MAACFTGNYEHSLDDKGRVIVPAKIREQVLVQGLGQADGFVVTPSPDGCLFLYTAKEWESIAEQLASQPRGSAALRKFQRKFFSMAEYLKLDSQSRILIPERLRTRAGIGKELVFAGSYDRIEVWSKASWEAQLDDDDALYEEQFELFLGGQGQEPSPEDPSGSSPA
ncbi:MAG: division/cell wall cluster transcriptional repressor MraZ [Planctomycetota bacterium]|jgi:MraZ protein